MTREEFTEIMIMVKDVFEDKFSMKEERMETFYNLLNDLDYEMLKESTENMLKDITYPPVVADFRKAYQEVYERERDHRLLIESIYERAYGTWPLRANEDTAPAKKEWMVLIFSQPKEKQKACADYLLDEIRDYVRKAEREKNNDIETFAQHIKDFAEAVTRKRNGKTD